MNNELSDDLLNEMENAVFEALLGLNMPKEILFHPDLIKLAEEQKKSLIAMNMINYIK